MQDARLACTLEFIEVAFDLVGSAVSTSTQLGLTMLLLWYNVIWLRKSQRTSEMNSVQRSALDWERTIDWGLCYLLSCYFVVLFWFSCHFSVARCCLPYVEMCAEYKT
jgi:ABC-type Fe3+ transport system permease subunit